MKGMLLKPWKIKAIANSSPYTEWQTRRTSGLYDVNMVGLDGAGKHTEPSLYEYHGIYNGVADFARFAVNVGGINVSVMYHCKPRYQVGEIVYIKEECFIYEAIHGDWMAIYDDETERTVYPSELFISKHLVENTQEYTGRTCPAWAARYFTRITDVRAERLQEITEDDAIKEGCQLIARTIQPFELKPKPHFIAPERPFTHRDHFIGIWDSINKPPYDWNSNPHVWVYSFELQK